MSVARAEVQYHATVREMSSDDRPRERLMKLGAASLKNEELLAIILRVGTQGENLIELSRRLLDVYGGLGGLLQADTAVIAAERGMGEAKATQLKAALALGHRLSILTPDRRPQIASPGDVANLVMDTIGFQAQEQLWVLCLDSKHCVVTQQLIYQGTVTSSVVRVAEVFKPAISRTSPAIIVVHNHPSGDPAPSPEDVRTTEQLRKAGELLDIELLDHIVVGHNRFVSMKERHLGF